jgi:hypothetical protein
LATERQIQANRRNAQSSTGPKSLAGKLKSSRNAYRHGLSGPVKLDSVALAKVDAIAHALAGNDASEDRLTSAADFARAQFQLLIIRSTRTEIMARFDPQNLQELRRLAALDRYERGVLTKRRRASVKF